MYILFSCKNSCFLPDSINEVLLSYFYCQTNKPADTRNISGACVVSKEILIIRHAKTKPQAKNDKLVCDFVENSHILISAVIGHS